MRRMTWMVLASALVIGSADEASAQDVGKRTVTARAGGLMVDAEGDASKLMLGLGVDWQLSKHVLAEVDGSWSLSDGLIVDYSDPTNYRSWPTKTHLATATVGVQAQAVLGPVRPYVGIATGLFVHYDVKAGGDRFPRYTTAFPLGVRVDVTDRIGLRGELRPRFDVAQSGNAGINLEQTLGLSLRF